MKFKLESVNISESLMEQLHLLLATPVGTVVLDRDFGVDMSFIDMPINLAKNMAAAEFGKKIKKYIPAIRLTEITEDKSQASMGELSLKVVVELAD